MDAHYHKVMNARNAIQDNGTKLYFAYSGVLDSEAFEAWKDEHSYQFFTLPEGQVAAAQNMDLIFDFPSRWWGGRVAGLTEKENSQVWGKLYAIEAKNWPIIQHKEGVVTGMSIEIPIEVKVDDKSFTAIAFATNPERKSTQGSVSPAYVEALIRGAKAAGLPSDYITSLTQKAT